eukprot:TRINITY_DN321_c0_g1_i1.p1 TRINITY_DN321_c0_g1~~TRINITY_DN321_c0_g1_i1.p1  ORF type:complete len:166 (+),score=19.14 TRINITY_DN321_c0_g1_i1:45-542(+)
MNVIVALYPLLSAHQSLLLYQTLSLLASPVFTFCSMSGTNRLDGNLKGVFNDSDVVHGADGAGNDRAATREAREQGSRGPGIGTGEASELKAGRHEDRESWANDPAPGQRFHSDGLSAARNVRGSDLTNSSVAQPAPGQPNQGAGALRSDRVLHETTRQMGDQLR